MRDQVLSILAHDLRGPLNAIHSWAHVLERKLASDDAGVQRALAGVKIGVDQQLRLIEGVIDRTRSQTRNLSLRRQPTALGPLLESVLDHFAKTAGAGAIVEAGATQSLPREPVLLDAELVWQALWTMLAFAVEAADAPARVWLETDARDGQWRVSLSFVARTALDGARPPSEVFGALGHIVLGNERWPLALSLAARVAEAHEGRFEYGEPVPQADSGDAEGGSRTASLRLPLVASP